MRVWALVAMLWMATTCTVCCQPSLILDRGPSTHRQGHGCCHWECVWFRGGGGGRCGQGGRLVRGGSGDAGQKVQKEHRNGNSKRQSPQRWTARHPTYNAHFTLRLNYGTKSPPPPYLFLRAAGAAGEGHSAFRQFVPHRCTSNLGAGSRSNGHNGEAQYSKSTQTLRSPLPI